MTKKNFALLMGVISLAYSVLAIYLHNKNFLGPISPFFEYTSLYVFTPLISIPAYFLRKEVHDFCFKWMMCIYMPIACVVVFYVARHEKPHMFASGANTLVSAGLAVLLFFVLSVALILAKHDALKRKQGA